ncbi:hypothetical protein RYH73_16475 [Olivibacter sp. CPCC 100613]|uniref:hypothetical protein n=1 Tax=Olivibacter sp. CPCC 100613 TaxID=3079931 RepID=UPI002FF9A23C
MKGKMQKKAIKKIDLPKNLQPIIKPIRNTRTQIRQLLRSFIPLHPSEDTTDLYQQLPN